MSDLDQLTKLMLSDMRQDRVEKLEHGVGPVMERVFKDELFLLDQIEQLSPGSTTIPDRDEQWAAWIKTPASVDKP